MASSKAGGKRFVRILIWVLVAYAPFAAILTLGSDTTLGGALVFGCIVVPVVATFATVVMFKADASGEASDVPPSTTLAVITMLLAVEGTVAAVLRAAVLTEEGIAAGVVARQGAALAAVAI